MYSLSIFFGPSPVPAQFLFKEKAKAEGTMLIVTRAETDKFEIEDEYGQRGIFDRSQIHAVILEDMDLGEESRIQRGLSQARGQANANKRAMADPILQAANRAQSPSVISPFNNGRFG